MRQILTREVRIDENKNKCISFYKPKGLLPKDFHCLGHYCLSDSHPLRGYVLATRDLVDSVEQGKKPALVEPVDFTPVWSSNDSSAADKEERNTSERGYFWLLQPPEGYRSMGFVVTEPPWLQYMREWGPKIVYDSREEIERLANWFPRTFGVSIANVLRKLPVELSGEEGPTGPKEKNNWYGDERW